jgi:hypothetical protein
MGRKGPLRMLLTRTSRLALAGVAVAALAAAQARLTGRVVDENEAPVAHARISARQGQGAPQETFSGPSGEFRLRVPAPGRYLVDVDCAGYYQLAGRPVDIGAEGAEMTLVLNAQREVFQSITVGEAAASVEPDQTQREQRLSGTEINDIPYPASHSLRNSMKLVPGVIQDPSGGVHFHGGAEYQTQYTLDGFDISDPVTGRYSTRLAVEGVRTLELVSSRESPQYGRGSAGTLKIETDNGTDQFRYTGTNFVPGVDLHGGLRLGNWTPRAGVSGPIVKGRAWFSDSFDGDYNSGYINGLPKGQDTNAAWYAGNLFHTQVNLSPSDILYTDLLTNIDHEAHYGLGALDPVSTTTSLAGSEWLAAVKESHSWYGGAMLEAGFGWQRGFHRRTPLGIAPYFITPEGRSGNYFVESREDGRRAQFFVNYYPRQLHFAGRHQLQLGADVQHLDYAARFQRSELEVIGLSGLPLFQTSFQGSGDFAQSDTSQAAYVNDHWQPLERLTVDAGVRQDWDGLVGRSALGPRVSAAWAPFAGTRTKITGGYAVVHDAVYLSLFSRPLDQQAVTVPYTGGVPGSPLVTTFLPGRDLRLPRSATWSTGVEHELPRRILAHAEWLRRRGRDGFVYAAAGAVPGSPVSLQPQLLGYGFGGTYALTNQRRDAYDEGAVTIRQTFGNQYGWLASYVRSRAVSNSVLDVSVDQPLQVMNNFGRMPWDSPNRLLGWGYFPLPWKNWAWAFVADWRSGFPFAVVNDAGTVVGAVDSHGYPSNFDFNLAIERRFTFHGYRLAIRLGGNNLTDHPNPTAVNNVIGAPQFLQFYGNEGRHFVVRLRVFGKA